MGIVEYLDSLKTSSKARSEITATLNSSGYRLISGAPTSAYTYTSSLGWAQETLSLNHPEVRVKGYRPRDVGGPFFSRKVSLTTQNTQHNLRVGGVTGTYLHFGAIWPNPSQQVVSRLAVDIFNGRMKTNSAWTSDNALSRANLKAEGLKLMLSAMPASPAYSLANSLGELISERAFFGIPAKEWFMKEREATSPGEYLNLQFGILPVVSDVQDYLAASKKSEEIISQYIRDAGKLIHRRRILPTSVELTHNIYTTGADAALLSGHIRPLNTGMFRNGKMDVRTRTERDIWFTGAYQYYVPEQMPAWLKTLFANNAVYGMIPSPKTLWELTPFSWLTDWMTNAGDIVSGMFSAGPDGSVLVRGYVMCKTRKRTEYTWTGELSYASGWKRQVLTWTVDETIKQRERARPSGLDWKLDGLSAKQISILTALGLSHRK